MQVSQFEILIAPEVKLLVYSASAVLYEDENAADYGESRWQLQEGKEYEYELLDSVSNLPVDWSLEGSVSMIRQNPRHRNRGVIVTGIYVGTTHFIAVNAATGAEVPVDFEILSVKASYRSDYRHMLSDITAYYTDLVMQQGSPITQKFDLDYDTPQRTLYQKFAFVRSIVEDDRFDEAIQKIISNPVRKWAESTCERHVESVKKLSHKELRQLVSRKDRVAYPGAVMGLGSIPRYLTVAHKIDSLDTPENQFVKYVLVSLYGFCSSLHNKKNATAQLRKELNAVCNILAGYMNSLFFKGISSPSQLNLGSPVLQRKEGYREILQAWLMFDLAAKLAWTGGDDVYEAGKKNVAVLYEYWIFFKLMECVSEIFNVPAVEKESLISNDSDGINLEIRQGRTKMIGGSTQAGNRKLNISLYYNRTFAHTDDIYSSGSWTMNMRPDYTLSIWPGNMTEFEAEHEDAIVHIHFDAKYRLNKIIIEDKEIDIETQEQELHDEKENREIDIYKRGDLLKMHAYKDAIRRTGGAYVLYPGTEKKIRKGFHEIIPGLGAFCVAPGREDEQLPALKLFLKDIVAHFMDRTTQREKLAVAGHEIYSKVSDPFYEMFPEPYGNPVFPDAVRVLLGSYIDEEHLRWILSQGKYNISCSSDGEGRAELSDATLTAQYLLLYDQEDLSVKHIMKMTKQHPLVVTDSMLANISCPARAEGQLYLLYDVSESAVEPELLDRPWSIEPFIKDKKGTPQTVIYTNLFSEP